MPQRGPRRIGLVGGESTGKTTLAHDLAAAMGACVVPEELRTFVATHGRTPRRDEQAGILAAQAAAEDAVAVQCPHDLVVADAAPLMTAVYSLLYFDDPSLLPAALEHARGYDLVVWCAPDPAWTADDGQRDGPGHRDAAERILSQLATEELPAAGIPVLRVSGGPEERVAAVRLAWQPGPLQGLT